jgi:hypothetical protein
MPRWLLLSALALGLASPAGAGTLTSASWTQTVSPPIPGIALGFTRTNAQLGAIGSSTSTSISVSLSFPFFATSAVAPATSMVILTRTLAVTLGGSQTIMATAGMADGLPAVPGSVSVKGHAPDPMDFLGTLIRVPLNVGAAGVFTGTFNPLGVYGHVTVDFFAWTPGTLTFGGLTFLSVPIPNVTVMGSFQLTALGGGTVTLVSPSKITTQSTLAPARSLLSVSTLRLTFVPEPGTLLLLATGALVLARVVRRR